MISHHPSPELLMNFVNGDLPASLSIGVSVHVDMCPQCQQHIAHLTEQVAESSFELTNDVCSHSDTTLIADMANFENMIECITDSDEKVENPLPVHKLIEIKGQQYPLPAPLNHVNLGKTTNVGKLTRARIQLDEGEIHSSLLHIEPGGSVPSHTHKGFELTVLLNGSFTDEKGTYQKGDFIMLDKSHHHNPVSEAGCLCFTVANDALHFTQGFNKLLNPIGGLIY